MLWYSIAGGEPFIRKDLGHIISEIQQKNLDLKFYHYQQMVGTLEKHLIQY